VEAPITVEHLIDEHGIDKAVLQSWGVNTDEQNARRLLSLQLEMRHSIDHAQRKVGHEHIGDDVTNGDSAIALAPPRHAGV
jgi:hypothetical protein